MCCGSLSGDDMLTPDMKDRKIAQLFYQAEACIAEHPWLLAFP